MKPAISLFGVIAIVLWLQPCVSGANTNIQPWGGPQRETFPPESPPPGMAGDADEHPEVTVTPRCMKIVTSRRIYLTGGVVDANGVTHIRLPSDADPNLNAHEDGHDEVNKSEWNRKAKKKIDEAFKGFPPIWPINPPQTAKDVEEDIRKELDRRKKKAEEAIVHQMNEANARYDAPDMTNGGRNGPLTPAEAVKKIEEEEAKAEQKKLDKNNKEKPSEEEEAKEAVGGTNAKKKQQTEEEAAKIGFDPNTFPLNSTDAGDMMNDRAAIQLGDVVPLGNDGPGIVYCSDTHVRLLDTGMPDGVFFDATLYAVRVAPSTLPGYSQMLQGVLNVWEINNTIGSDFLYFVQQAKEEEEYLSLWFYATEPMVDEDGEWIAAGNVNGQVIIGIAVDADITMTEDFEDYDPISFMSAWMPVGSGDCMLEPAMAHSGRQAMRLMVNNMMAGSYSGATHTYPVMQDLSGQGRSLDIYILREYPQPPVEDFYVTLQDAGGMVVMFSLATAGEEEYASIMSTENEWVGISINTKVFEQLIDLAHIERITVGFESDIPTVGTVVIDDISVHERRRLGYPEGDLDLDSRVTMTDLAVLASHWLEEAYWPALSGN